MQRADIRDVKSRFFGREDSSLTTLCSIRSRRIGSRRSSALISDQLAGQERLVSDTEQVESKWERAFFRGVCDAATSQWQTDRRGGLF